MNSIIFSAVARIFFVLMCLVSLLVLYRGHNEPGGGFIGGLVAAAGFAILALADGVEHARRMLRANPVIVIGVGLFVAVLSGIPGLLRDGSYLTHQWMTLAGIDVGTTLLFDIGVYLVVLGGILALIIRFYEEL